MRGKGSRTRESEASRACIYVGGAGVSNDFGREILAKALDGVIVGRLAEAGVPADAAEAMAFSLMGRNTLCGIPNQLPQCTGVREARILGVVHGAEWAGSR